MEQGIHIPPPHNSDNNNKPHPGRYLYVMSVVAIELEMTLESIRSILS